MVVWLCALLELERRGWAIIRIPFDWIRSYNHREPRKHWIISISILRPNKKKPEIPITLPTLNYLATLFHIFIFMQIYAIFYLIMLIFAHFNLIMLIYANFMKMCMKFFDKAKKPWLMSNKLFDRNVKLKSSTLNV